MNNVTIARRKNLERLVDECGLARIAERAGKPPSQIRDMLAGRKSFGEKIARDLEKALEPTRAPLWLDASGSNLEQGPGEEIPTNDEFALIPQLDVTAACGAGRFTDHIIVKGGLAFKRTSLKKFGVSEQFARIIYASGTSMAPTIQDGCVVLLNTADITPKDGKVYAICTPEGDLILKRLIRDYHPSIGESTWILRSDNPNKIQHPDRVLPPDNRTIIVGRAVWNDNQL